MKSIAARSVEASRLRQRKFELVRRYQIPEALMGGSFGRSHRRCGKPNCHCATGVGHANWILTSSHRGVRRVERVPAEWVKELEQAVLDTQAYLDAIKEVMAINIELLAHTRAQHLDRKRTLRKKIGQNRPTKAKKRSTRGVSDRS